MTAPERTDRINAVEGVDKERAELLRLSGVILEAICSHDKEALEALLHPDFVLVGDSARHSRSEFLEGVGAGGFVALAHGFESIEIEIFGTTAAAAGIQRVDVELPDGTRAVSRGGFTDFFVKTDTGWRIRFAHSVELP